MCISSAVANHEVVFDQHGENEWLVFRVSAREYFINNILGKEAFFPFVTHSPRILRPKYSHLPRWEYKQSDFNPLTPGSNLQFTLLSTIQFLQC